MECCFNDIPATGTINCLAQVSCKQLLQVTRYLDQPKIPVSWLLYRTGLAWHLFVVAPHSTPLILLALFSSLYLQRYTR